jgi:cytochrome P450
MSEPLEIGVNEGERQRNRRNALGIVNELHARLDELRLQGDVHPQGFAQLFGQTQVIGADAPGTPRFSVLGFDSADQAFRQHEVFSSRFYASLTEVWGPNMLAMDEPEHRRYRALVQPAFANRTMTRWQSAWLEPILDQLIAGLGQRPKAELYMDYCARFPAHTIARSFGIESANVEETHDLVLRMSADADPASAAAAGRRVAELIGSAIADRRKTPQDDVISVLATSELVDEDGTRQRLSDREILGFAGLMLTAGSGTTYRSLGTILLALLQRPALLARVAADRSLVPGVVEETLRWEPPLTYFSRVAKSDAKLGDTEIPKGAVVDVSVTAANHDPRRWSDPHAFDPERPLLPHLGFASGPHFCIGNQLARMELKVALERLLDRFPRMRLDPEQPEPYMTGVLLRMPTALPVILEP